ncbi:transporter substrate-binding domain-containing protein [Shouchella clausii]|jgi:aspartate/glutamate/glutamine transport system substrate-binding protein|uniref:Glutamine ABC transporter substrate-binding protein n=3 Tax=Shouchella TaxID=2893057 RepID=Q5WJZ5_SHOC1|nr:MULTISPECIES: transporter substrate-binding domain-containing protein [Shouchella]MCM3314150.1 transporter substrate-binding domain-containing protein [Psychrobacillus sp. MER TA 17]ALA52061.1 Glutamine ABC transporter, periplasmic glutamine-binding protein [Shouchella clausii]MBU3230490.1 transporter substrate-binding domain-containing protein [Shouchella clausii]MBU3262311.1 transporter substrate-binding domain-containing protein [Shouchella clausii]MBU3507374.1 transporter substrate-bind
MKKWMNGLLAGAAVLALSACGGGDETVDGSTENSNEESTLAKIEEADKFVVGVKFDTRLFGLKDPGTGEVEGFDIDIAKEIAKELLGDENKIELKEVTSKTRIPLLDNGQIDAIIATMTITEERKKEVNFSDVYFEAGQSLLVEKGSDIQGIDDIGAGTKVLAVKGATSGQNLLEQAPDAEVIELENYQEAFLALQSGQGDALTTDNSILYGMAEENSDYEVVGGTFTDEPYGIAVRKGDDEFTEKINEILADLKASGRYDEIYEKWIGESPE